MDGLIERRGGDLDSLMGQAAVANAKIAYQDFKGTFSTDRFGALARKGARVQRPLWASTSAKNPEYSDVLYVETLVGADTVNTMPDATLEAFLDHGKANATIENDVEASREAMNRLEGNGISIDSVTTTLMHEGVKAFADSFELLLDDIQAKRDRLMAGAAVPVGAGSEAT